VRWDDTLAHTVAGKKEFSDSIALIILFIYFIFTDLIICIVWPAVDPEDGGI
jgi:hypothetical protein